MSSRSPGHLAKLSFDARQLATLRALGEYRGKQQLYVAQPREGLGDLRPMAVVEFTESSNRREGVVVAYRLKSFAIPIHCVGCKVSMGTSLAAGRPLGAVAIPRSRPRSMASTKRVSDDLAWSILTDRMTFSRDSDPLPLVWLTGGRNLKPPASDFGMTRVMVTRREFILSGSATIGTLAAVASCSSETADAGYANAVSNTWRHGMADAGDNSALLRELVRCATLAPSSHNTQCWKFRLEHRSISILPDFSRRCPAVDPDDHHLFVSIGCAAENLLQAALANGLYGNLVFDDSAGKLLRIALEPTKVVATSLFNAIPERQSTRAEYDGKPISARELALLEKASQGNGVRVILLTGREALEKVLEYVVQGNAAQMRDPAFVEELKAWIRFNADDAVRTGDGLYAASSGNPSVPSWLGRLLFGLFFTPKAENEKYAKHVRSSAGIAVFVSEGESPAQWIEVGRCYERFALQSAALGIRNSMLNQPVEVPTLRPQFATFLGVGGCRPDLVVRFGRGPKLPPSLRRPIDAVLT